MVKSRFKSIGKSCLFIVALSYSTFSYAVPTLQIGVPDGMGGYVSYTSGTDPSEADTALTSGNTLAVAGTYGPNDLLVGGQYADTYDNWSALGFNGAFDLVDAVIMATVSGSGSLSIDSLSSFYSTSTFEDGFTVPNPPGNHAPLQDSSVSGYMFFDIGNFANNPDAVTDFADSTSTAKDGEIKTLTFDVQGFNWIHFDVFALITDDTGKTYVSTTGNPGSHDATWTPPPIKVPESSTLALIGLGLLGLAGFRKITA